MTGRRTLHVHRLGEVGYDETHELQRQLVTARQAGDIGDTLLLLEHRPVITMGRGGKADHILHGRDWLASQGIEVHDIGRGGDVTYHGPGQLVGYPIIDLKPDRRDVRKYVWTLEETMIRLAARYGIEAGRVQGLNGAWVGDRKIGAVGVRISRWVTMHGFAINNTTNMGHFQLIVPCGIEGKGVTSLQLERAEDSPPVPMAELEDAAADIFAEMYEADIAWYEGPPPLPAVSEDGDSP